MKNIDRTRLTSQCQMTNTQTKEQICDRDIWGVDEKRCIFHSKEKLVEDFKKQFLKELKKVNETDSIDEFDGRFFIFPEKMCLTGKSP